MVTISLLGLYRAVWYGRGLLREILDAKFEERRYGVFDCPSESLRDHRKMGIVDDITHSIDPMNVCWEIGVSQLNLNGKAPGNSKFGFIVTSIV